MTSKTKAEKYSFKFCVERKADMAKVFATIKAILTRLVFSAHGLLAIWQVTLFKKDSHYWYLSAPVLLLSFEAIFTLSIKRNQEWKWFCPSVFLYLLSVVPSIWLLELDKLETKHRIRQGIDLNNTAKIEGMQELERIIRAHIQLPMLFTSDTWLTLIEQFLMLILIIGRWMLPKGDLTRDQLSQLLLVYIGTAADIIEFFDTFQDDTIGNNPVLTMLTLSIWSWSLLQFTVVLSATKSSRRSRISAPTTIRKRSNNTNSYCCSADVWAILINILLQDAPFVTFRLLLIFYYQIISYMNVFFTCKNTLVIALQLYRLHVVYAERKIIKKKMKPNMKSSSFIIEGEMNRKKKKARINNSRSCSELVELGVNPSGNLRLLLSEEAALFQKLQGRKKSLSDDNVNNFTLEVYSDIEEDEDDDVEEEDERNQDEIIVVEEEGEESSSSSSNQDDDDDILADLTPAQINLLRSAAAAKIKTRGQRQDTGYSTASSSRGSTRCTSRTSNSGRIASNNTKSGNKKTRKSGDEVKQSQRRAGSSKGGKGKNKNKKRDGNDGA